jgi:DNA-binding NarL/FixJ family response regulator
VKLLSPASRDLFVFSWLIPTKLNLTCSAAPCVASRVMRVACCQSKLSHCLEALRSAPADVVLLSDDSSDHEHLIDTIRSPHGNFPDIRLILLSDSYDRSLVVNAMRAGARGLFCRASQPFCALRRCIIVV